MDRCINRRGRAFTLLETLLALGLAATLISGVYAIASGTTQLSSEISRDREQHLVEQAFVALCRKNLGGLPAGTGIRLRTAKSGLQVFSEIVISGDPTAFGFSRVPSGATAVVLYSQPDTGGRLRVNLKYLDEQDVVEFDRGNRKAGRDLNLLRGVRRFEWRFFDRRGNRWKSDWDIQAGRPAFAELHLEIDGGESRHVFWLPDLQAIPLPLSTRRPVQETQIDDDN